MSYPVMSCPVLAMRYDFVRWRFIFPLVFVLCLFGYWVCTECWVLIGWLLLAFFFFAAWVLVPWQKVRLGLDLGFVCMVHMLVLDWSWICRYGLVLEMVGARYKIYMYSVYPYMVRGIAPLKKRGAPLELKYYTPIAKRLYIIRNTRLSNILYTSLLIPLVVLYIETLIPLVVILIPLVMTLIPFIAILILL